MDIYSAIKEYIQENRHNLIGSGSGRIVYDLYNGYVVKVAKNRKGIAQNKMEDKIFNELKFPILASVVYLSTDAMYLIAQKAEKLPDEDYILDYYEVNSFRELMRLKEIQTLIRQYGVVEEDLWHFSSWGLIDGVPVLVDYGFTVEIRRKYYW